MSPGKKTKFEVYLPNKISNT